MRLNELAKEAYNIAAEKGWWDEDVKKRPLECHALIVSEVAEAMEAWRAAWPATCVENPECPGQMVEVTFPIKEDIDLNKPEGEAVELADALIRIADYFQHRGWDLEAVVKAKMEYNKTRTKMHGGKRA